MLLGSRGQDSKPHLRPLPSGHPGTLLPRCWSPHSPKHGREPAWLAVRAPRSSLLRGARSLTCSNGSQLMDFGIIDVATCEPVSNVLVDIWHANTTGELLRRPASLARADVPDSPGHYAGHADPDPDLVWEGPAPYGVRKGLLTKFPRCAWAHLRGLRPRLIALVGAGGTRTRRGSGQRGQQTRMVLPSSPPSSRVTTQCVPQAHFTFWRRNLTGILWKCRVGRRTFTSRFTPSGLPTRTARSRLGGRSTLGSSLSTTRSTRSSTRSTPTPRTVRRAPSPAPIVYAADLV